jgi:hypothetical protein
MPRSFACWGTFDRVSDHLRASATVQPEKAHMILIEWLAVWTASLPGRFRGEKNLLFR